MLSSWKSDPEEITFLVGERHQYRDADMMVRLLTVEKGAITAVARALRRSRRRFPAGLEPYAVYTGQIVRGRGGWELKEAFLVRDFFSISGRMELVAAAACGVWATSVLLQDEEPEPRLVRLLENYLEFCARGQALPAAFFYAALKVAGFPPAWISCVECGASPPAAGWFYSPRHGGVRCPVHSRGEGLMLTDDDLRWFAGPKEHEPRRELLMAMLGTVEHLVHKRAPCSSML